ncbi:MAG: GNAT family N-acetyltransferase [Woeseiaceae bacterium]|nr:GNAT family N-acetyltransferase [Woeseiaceae bacterium]
MTKEHPDNTARLRLRRLTLDDADLMLGVWNDPAFIRYVGDRGIRTVVQAHEAMLEGPMMLYETYGYGPYRIALRDSDTPIGICGIFRRDGLDEPDIGFSTLPEYCGNGFAYEAACAVIEYARKDLGLSVLNAIVSPDNAASIGLIRKLGLSFERMYEWPDSGEQVAIYAMQLTV